MSIDMRSAYLVVIAGLAAVQVAACGKDGETQQVSVEPSVVNAEQSPASPDAAPASGDVEMMIEQQRKEMAGKLESMKAQMQDYASDSVSVDDIPYPMYKDLKVFTAMPMGGGKTAAAFVSSDDFATVDTFYKKKAASGELVRKQVFDDMVIYLPKGSNADTYQMGSQESQVMVSAIDEAMAAAGMPEGSKTRIDVIY